jgi:REP element-mobilizing transposase RayT
LTCYGAWLHGDKRLLVNRSHHQIGTPYLPANLIRENCAKNRMIDKPYLLEPRQQKIVLDSIKETCIYRQWALLAAHVRTNHVHVIVHALTSPEIILNSFKSYCSRKLNQSQIESAQTKRWARHGSTRYLWKTENVESAIHYVVYEQGAPMAVYENLARILEA